MNVTVAHAVVHTPEQVREIIADALAVTLEHGAGGVAPEAIFAQACQLLGARVSFATPEVPVQLPQLGLANMRAGR